MRRILVDDVFHNKVVDFFKKELADFTNKALNGLNSIRDTRDKSTYLGLCETEYIEGIILRYNEIILAKPNELNLLIEDFNMLLTKYEITTEFHESVTKALMYSDLREKLVPLIQDIKIKACVYCNAQLTTVVDIDTYKNTSIIYGYKKGDIKTKLGRFELDHFQPKSHFPFLASSFYNLIPCCSNCNKTKSSKPSKFNFYTEEFKEIDAFAFILTDDSKDKYLLSKNPDDLVVQFIHINGNTELLENHKDLFHIEQLYDTQRDVIEELALIEQCYNDSAKADLIENYKALFQNKEMLNRIIIGNYSSPEDIHKRPLAKFTQDIAIELNSTLTD